MREKPGYRDNLERLNELFPNCEAFNATQIAMIWGVDQKTAIKATRDARIPGTKLVSKATLARLMAG